MPNISLIIPVHNTERYLHECLDSVLAQHGADIEVVCIDDGSTDRSPAILKDYAQNDSRVRVLTQENSGYAKSANRGVREARGDWICFVDSDDILEQDACRLLLETALASGANTVVGDYLRFSGDGTRTLVETDKRIKNQPELENRIIPAATPLFHSFPMMWAALYQREFLLQEGILCDEATKIFSDQSFCCALMGCPRTRLFYLPEPLYRWRQDGVGNSNLSPQRGESILFSLGRIRDRHPQGANPYFWEGFLRMQFLFFVSILHQHPAVFKNHLDLIQEQARLLRAQPGFDEVSLSPRHQFLLRAFAQDARGFFGQYQEPISRYGEAAEIIVFCSGDMPKGLSKRQYATGDAAMLLVQQLHGANLYSRVIAFAVPTAAAADDPDFDLRLRIRRMEPRPLVGIQELTGHKNALVILVASKENQSTLLKQLKKLGFENTLLFG
jgi:hypothetical protein